MDKEGEEVDKLDSYFRYFLDIKLCEKSAYSSGTNPSLHLVMHIVSTTMNQSSSINARYVAGANIDAIMLNAQTIAYAFTKIGNFSIQFGTADQLALIALKKKSKATVAATPVDPNTITFLNLKDMGLHFYSDKDLAQISLEMKLKAPVDGEPPLPNKLFPYSWLRYIDDCGGALPNNVRENIYAK